MIEGPNVGEMERPRVVASLAGEALSGVARRGYVPNVPLSPEEIRSLHILNTYATLLAVAIDWFLIVLVATGSWYSFARFGFGVGTLVLYALAILVIGSRQKGLENLTHEGLHHHLSDKRKVNDWISKWLCGMWIAPSFEIAGQRVTHVGDHHGHFAEPGRDIEFYGYQNVGLGRLPESSIIASGRTLFWVFLRKTWWRIHSDYVSVPNRLLIIAGALIILYLLGVMHLLLLYWVVPYLAAYLPMRYLSEVSEHMGLALGSEFSTTRNKLGWFQEWIMQPHGDGYHLVHHLYPGIPHNNLRRAHRLLMRDNVYRLQGHHTYAVVYARKRSSTLGDLLATGTPSVAGTDRR